MRKLGKKIQTGVETIESYCTCSSCSCSCAACSCSPSNCGGYDSTLASVGESSVNVQVNNVASSLITTNLRLGS